MRLTIQVLPLDASSPRARPLFSPHHPHLAPHTSAPPPLALDDRKAVVLVEYSVLPALSQTRPSPYTQPRLARAHDPDAK
jgi:hypothetical protein